MSVRRRRDHRPQPFSGNREVLYPSFSQRLEFGFCMQSENFLDDLEQSEGVRCLAQRVSGFLVVCDCPIFTQSPWSDVKGDLYRVG